MEDLAPLLRGDRLAVAAALNDAEDERPAARARTQALLARLHESRVSDRARRVGVTGPPGVGKSSLVAAATHALRAGASPRTVGILAVDPSSLRSGGALLGDRIRIAAGADDPGVFIRSLATRGELGGLARAIPDEVIVMSAAFDVVIVETVGVGQSEADVRDVVDVLLFVVQPGGGDTLQYLKAGVMETPDVLVVNKADLGDLAARTRAELGAALGSLKQAGVIQTAPPVVSTSARDGTGIAELVARFDAPGIHAGAAQRRVEGSIAQAMRRLRRRYGEVGLERLGGDAGARLAVERAVQAGEPVEAIVDRLNPFR